MTTYYVVGSGGSDVADGLSEGNGWATINYAMTQVAAADKVYVKASAVYSETPVIITVGVSTANQHIEFEGYTTTPGDEGKATITGTTNCLTSALGAAYYWFKNFIFTGASSDGVSMSNTDWIRWTNCEFSNNGSRGIFGDNDHVFDNCIAYGNSDMGFDMDNNTFYIGCIAYGNGSNGMQAFNLNSAYKCLSYDNAGPGIQGNSVTGGIFACTIDGDNTSGNCVGNTSAKPIIVDNILYDPSTNGAGLSSAARAISCVDYNLHASNINNYSPLRAYYGAHDVEGAPAFTDEDNDDYTLSESSPAIDAGIQPGTTT
jgi:hypothetical protein